MFNKFITYNEKPTGIQILNEKRVTPGQKLSIALDTHGTVFQPNWEPVYYQAVKSLIRRKVNGAEIRKNIIGKNDQQIYKFISNNSNYTIEEAEEYFQLLRKNIRELHVPTPMPKIEDFLAILKQESKIKLYLLSLSDEELVNQQLLRHKLSKFFSPQQILCHGANSKLNCSRSTLLELQARKYPDHQIILFDDWITGMETAAKLNGINFAILDRNNATQINKNIQAFQTNQADYILHNGWNNYHAILEILGLH